METGPKRVYSRRAFENELGVQAPVGFWDPAGLSADGRSASAASYCFKFNSKEELQPAFGPVSKLYLGRYTSSQLYNVLTYYTTMK